MIQTVSACMCLNWRRERRFLFEGTVIYLVYPLTTDAFGFLIASSGEIDCSLFITLVCHHPGPSIPWSVDAEWTLSDLGEVVNYLPDNTATWNANNLPLPPPPPPPFSECFPLFQSASPGSGHWQFLNWMVDLSVNGVNCDYQGVINQGVKATLPNIDLDVQL